MRIPCPTCGPRDLREFTYIGDALRSAPALEADADTWAAYVYTRRNPRGEHLEYWQHSHGCRQFLRVRRDTATHVIHAAACVGPHATEDEA
ncbi:MAG: sarcosine oxidase subunit delta [Rhodobacteraceae bacterium]|jgi:sarcosine oxidase subunit delta|nr:sarcosine oxidase subunit delta [Paracoccaceae bacterium]